MNNEPMTVEQFNNQIGTGCYTWTNDTPAVINVESGLNRTCPIHSTPMENIQHPMKPLGVIVAQICRQCQEELEKAKQLE
jgi:hypothetical protein